MTETRYTDNRIMIKKIITYPNPVLRQKATAVTVFDKKLEELAADMAETMYDAPGAGLAANQIGVAKQMVVINISKDDAEKEHLVLINPEILEGQGSEVDEEGCLSVLELTAKVKRFQKIKVRTQNLGGQARVFEAEDHFARVIQHEVDHLNGILFIDHLSPLKRTLYKKRLKKMLKEQDS